MRFFFLTKGALWTCTASLQGMSASPRNGMPQACSDTAFYARRPMHTLSLNKVHLRGTMEVCVAISQPLKSSSCAETSFHAA